CARLRQRVSRDLKRLFILPQDVLELRFVLGLSPGPGLVPHHTRRRRLPHALTRVRFYRLSHGKPSWLAFRHRKDEYGIESARWGRTCCRCARDSSPTRGLKRAIGWKNANFSMKPANNGTTFLPAPNAGRPPNTRSTGSSG